MWSRIALLAFSLQASWHAGAASAQQQTPENAQRFLALSLPSQYRYQLDGIDEAFTERRTAEIQAQDSNCRTTWPNGRTDQQTETSIDWRRTLEIRHNGRLVTLVVRNPHDIRVTWFFDLGADAAAARAAFAMEFLRQHCDPAVGTGF